MLDDRKEITKLTTKLVQVVGDSIRWFPLSLAWCRYETAIGDNQSFTYTSMGR